MADKQTCTDRETDSLPDGSSDDENGEPDPRIQKELDRLNLSSTEINRLENELDEARTKYRSIVSGTSGDMETIAKGRKKNIQKAREYYRLTIESKLAQCEALKAARQYQTASGIYNAAKETVALAENRLIEKATSSTCQLTSAWQEMLNNAIHRVTVAEKDKAKSGQDHRRRSAKFAELEARKQVLEKKFSKSIKKAKPYFELKAEMDIKLMQQKQNVIDLQAAIRCNKAFYNESLRKLESISEEIHQNRREKLWARIPRMPCVGADTESITSDLSEHDIVSSMNTEDFNSDTVDEFDCSIDEATLNRTICGLNKMNLDDEVVDYENLTFEQIPTYFEAGNGICGNITTNLEVNNVRTDKARDAASECEHDNDTACKVTDPGNQINNDNLNEIMEHTRIVTKEIPVKCGTHTNSKVHTSINVRDNGRSERSAECDMQNVPRPYTSGEE